MFADVNRACGGEGHYLVSERGRRRMREFFGLVRRGPVHVCVGPLSVCVWQNDAALDLLCASNTHDIQLERLDNTIDEFHKRYVP